MYKAVVTYRGRTYKSVTVSAPADAHQDDVFDAALLAADETRARLFGWNLTFRESIGDWNVNFYTD